MCDTSWYTILLHADHNDLVNTGGQVLIFHQLLISAERQAVVENLTKDRPGIMWASAQNLNTATRCRVLYLLTFERSFNNHSQSARLRLLKPYALNPSTENFSFRRLKRPATAPFCFESSVMAASAAWAAAESRSLQAIACVLRFDLTPQITERVKSLLFATAFDFSRHMNQVIKQQLVLEQGSVQPIFFTAC